jgi:hypothetical protein
MDHDPETKSWIHDLYGNAGQSARGPAEDPLEKFMQQVDLDQELARRRATRKSERGELTTLDHELDQQRSDELNGGRSSSPELDELRTFVKSERAAVEQKGINRDGVRASLSALRSILGRVIERV